MSEITNRIFDFHVRKMQRLFRKNKVLKSTTHFVNLQLVNQGKSNDFEKFTKLIKKKEIINVSKKLINSFILYKKDFKLTFNILLTAYLIELYQDELLGRELNQMDKSILEWSKEIITRISELNQSQEVDKVWLLLNNYYTIFNQWKNSDKSRMVESIIISYYNKSKHIEKIKEDKKLTDIEKKVCIEELDYQKREVLENVKFFDAEFDTEYFIENYEEVYNNMNKSYEKLASEVRNTMKKAYFDMLKEEIKSDNYLPLAEVMVEISKRILLLVPEKRREKFAEKINVEVIVELITEKQWTNELREYLKFICESVYMLGAPCDDTENKKWLNEVNNLMKSDYENNLPLILIQVEEKLDRIYQLINELNKK